MSETLQLVVLPSSQQTEDLLDILTIIKLSNYLFIVLLSNSKILFGTGLTTNALSEGIENLSSFFLKLKLGNKVLLK